MREDLFADACRLLRECVDGTVDDCTAWNRRTRAFLAAFDSKQPLEFDRCPSGRKCVQTTTGCLKGQCLERRVDKSSTKQESDSEWYEREKAEFIAWWESEGQKKFSETPTMAAGAGWFKRAEKERQS